MYCQVCNKEIKRKDNFLRHVRSHTHPKSHKCKHCDYSTDRKNNLTKHVNVVHNRPQIWRPWTINDQPTSSHVGPESAGESMPVDSGSSRQQTTHVVPIIHIAEGTTSTAAAAARLEEEMQEDSVHPEPDELAKLLEKNRKYLCEYRKCSNRVQDNYNFPIVAGNSTEMVSFLEKIWRDQKHPFKINMSFGFVLQQILTDELIYYYASTNSKLFPKPVFVQKYDDLTLVLEQFETSDLLEYCRRQRPNTKFVVRKITNVYIYIDKVRKYRIGAPPNLPDYIRNRRSLRNFLTDRWGQPYNDNLCFFRCLAFHVHNTKDNLEPRALQLYSEYYQRNHTDDFSGIELDELPLLEDHCNVNIEVYELSQVRVSLDGDDDVDDDDGALVDVAKQVFCSRKKYAGPTMKLNLFCSHFSLIVKFGPYASQWSCVKCGKLFDRHFTMNRHQRTCLASTKVTFVGGGYGQKKSMFELLHENGVQVPMELRFFPYRLAFDFESLCVPTPALTPNADKKEIITATLEPASVSVCSNVPGYDTPRCLISNGDPMELIFRLYNYITEISNRSRELMQERFARVLDILNTFLVELQQTRDRIQMITGKDDEEEEEPYLDDQADDEESAIELQQLRKAVTRHELYERLSKSLDKWIGRIVCLGFNSGKFDINLMRKYFFPFLLQEGVEVDQIIKKNNDYMSVLTPHAVFLDIKNYLAAGVSYDAWLKLSDITQQKGCFPYEWFTHIDKLDQTELPPKAEFWSSIRQTNISDEQYAELQTLWRENGFQTMRDLLIWYNNLDVGPFIQAAEKLYLYWKSLEIEPFKSRAISLPGLALCYLTKEMAPHTILPVFDNRNQDLYYLLRRNIVGGLSIVMHRYHERGITRLPNGSLVDCIYSFDCNALYLWALGQPMGTGLFQLWRPVDDSLESMPWYPLDDKDILQKEKWLEIVHRNTDQTFQRTAGYPYCKSELEWLEWTSFHLGLSVDHKFNGRQKTIVYSRSCRYPVDGYVPETNTVLQFHGCRWHGHGCRLDNNTGEESLRRKQRTERMKTEIEELGYPVVEKWECEWQLEKSQQPEIRNFLAAHLDVGTSSTHLVAGNIVKKILAEEIFGLIECDIEIPPFDKTNIAAFEEFPPICKNVEISMEDIGPHMQAYAEAHGFMKKPRKNLINSYWGRKILMATPLVVWLLQHGLVITRVYQVIQMKPKVCFTKIKDHIADMRRQADRDPAYKGAGENWKSLGNSLYGKTMTNKEKHKDHSLVADRDADKYVNDSRFNGLEEVGPLAYEVAMDKKSIKMDLPIIVAVFVYNYAKLNMLRFVYDFLRKYLRPGSYQMMCSDTDSIIAAYESSNLDDLVKPEMLEEYHRVGKRAFMAHDSYTKRTPGLYKEELKATGIVSLCSKTYFAWNDDDDSTKTSSKGLSKRTNKYTKHDFLRILETKVKGSGVNYGFRMVGNTLCQYQQERDGLAYLYVKRQVEDNGISTRALHL